MIQLTEEILDDYSSKLNVDLGAFFEEHFLFLRDDYPILLSYQNGVDVDYPNNEFASLLRITREARQILNSITFLKDSFNTLRDWDFIEYFDQLYVDLIFLNKLDKFLRSSKSNGKFSKRYEIEKTLPKNISLEKFLNLSDVDDYNNDWQEVAKRSDLSEIDYEGDGGQKIFLKVNLTTDSLNVRGVIDNFSDKSILGKDLMKNITFDTDDIKTLDFEQTFNQSAVILLNLVKGDVPEFLNFGVSEFRGENIFSFGIATYIRQLSEVFSSDDSIGRFEVNDVKIENGDVNLDISLTSKLEFFSKKNELTI